ncbi:hypothetical protein E4K64_15750 [Bradyrhizobium frederickii]|uniref:Uncharacterized protein n=1 Tax=Bradyrhizobium frederickii TaxID=2560054 RepID=A0A4Y9P461_9BRAD|nr:hypothetical protein E4K64_15750 [Bradyrhizobium frederickii]
MPGNHAARRIRQETGIKRHRSDATMLLVYNAHYDVVNFALPPVADGSRRLGLIDTNRSALPWPFSSSSPSGSSLAPSQASSAPARRSC